MEYYSTTKKSTGASYKHFHFITSTENSQSTKKHTCMKETKLTNKQTETAMKTLKYKTYLKNT